MVMFMIVYWSCECKFVFTTWWTKKDEQGKFMFGCFLTFLYCLFTQLYKISKIYVEPSKKEKTCHDPPLIERLQKKIEIIFKEQDLLQNQFAAGLTIGHLVEEAIITKMKSKVSDIEERLAGAVNCSESH